MPSLPSLNTTDFENALTPTTLQVDMIVQGSLAFGPSIFLLVSILALQGVPSIQPDAETASLYTTLLILLSAYTITSAAVGIFLYNLQFSPKRIASVVTGENPKQSGRSVARTSSERLIVHIRNAMIVQAALFESAAFFGLVIILLAAQQGVLYTLEYIWLATIPYVLLILLVIMTFPSKDRVMHIFREKILQ